MLSALRILVRVITAVLHPPCMLQFLLSLIRCLLAPILYAALLTKNLRPCQTTQSSEYQKAALLNQRPDCRGIAQFAGIIETFIRRIKVVFVNTIVRLESETELATAIELRIDR